MPIVVDGIRLEGPSGAHRIGVEVPGGSNCAKCRFLRNQGQCAHMNWVLAPVAQGGGGQHTYLPKPAKDWCCDYWEGG